MIIASGIRAVTLAGGAGVNIRTTVWSGAAPASTPKGHKDFTDLLLHSWTHPVISNLCGQHYLFGVQLSCFIMEIGYVKAVWYRVETMLVHVKPNKVRDGKFVCVFKAGKILGTLATPQYTVWVSRCLLVTPG